MMSYRRARSDGGIPADFDMHQSRAAFQSKVSALQAKIRERLTSTTESLSRNSRSMSHDGRVEMSPTHPTYRGSSASTSPSLTGPLPREESVAGKLKFGVSPSPRHPSTGSHHGAFSATATAPWATPPTTHSSPSAGRGAQMRSPSATPCRALLNTTPSQLGRGSQYSATAAAAMAGDLDYVQGPAASAAAASPLITNYRPNLPPHVLQRSRTKLSPPTARAPIDSFHVVQQAIDFCAEQKKEVSDQEQFQEAALSLFDEQNGEESVSQPKRGEATTVCNLSTMKVPPWLKKSPSPAAQQQNERSTTDKMDPERLRDVINAVHRSFHEKRSCSNEKRCDSAGPAQPSQENEVTRRNAATAPNIQEKERRKQIVQEMRALDREVNSKTQHTWATSLRDTSSELPKREQQQAVSQPQQRQRSFSRNSSAPSSSQSRTARNHITAPGATQQPPATKKMSAATASKMAEMYLLQEAEQSKKKNATSLTAAHLERTPPKSALEKSLQRHRECRVKFASPVAKAVLPSPPKVEQRYVLKSPAAMAQHLQYQRQANSTLTNTPSAEKQSKNLQQSPVSPQLGCREFGRNFLHPSADRDEEATFCVHVSPEVLKQSSPQQLCASPSPQQTAAPGESSPRQPSRPETILNDVRAKVQSYFARRSQSKSQSPQRDSYAEYLLNRSRKPAGGCGLAERCPNTHSAATNGKAVHNTVPSPPRGIETDQAAEDYDVILKRIAEMKRLMCTDASSF